MNARVRRLAAALILAAALVAGAAPATAVAQDNTAVAVNTKDDSSLFKLAFSIKQIASDNVDQANAAVAYSSCQQCQTLAIAIQVLIVTVEDPSVVTPTNLAIAINDQCSSCMTMALAYQFVMTNGRVRLTAAGRTEVARIRRELRELGQDAAGLTPDQIAARTDELVKQLNQVLQTELVPLGPGESGDQQPGDEGGLSDEQQPSEQQPTDTAPQTTTGDQPPPQETAPESTPAPQGDTTTTP